VPSKCRRAVTNAAPLHANWRCRISDGEDPRFARPTAFFPLPPPSPPSPQARRLAYTRARAAAPSVPPGPALPPRRWLPLVNAQATTRLAAAGVEPRIRVRGFRPAGRESISARAIRVLEGFTSASAVALAFAANAPNSRRFTSTHFETTYLKSAAPKGLTGSSPVPGTERNCLRFRGASRASPLRVRALRGPQVGLRGTTGTDLSQQVPTRGRDGKAMRLRRLCP
jgi:hypothetical protein